MSNIGHNPEEMNRAFFESFEGVGSQDEHVDHSLVNMRAQTRAASSDCLQSAEHQPRLTEAEFQGRVRELKEHPASNSHLDFGLSILAGILDRYPGKLVGEKGLNQLDGPQAVVNILLSYINQYSDELLPFIKPRSDQKPDQWQACQEDFQQFYTYEKYQLGPGNSLEQSQEHQRRLQQAYMTQLAHIAFHICYYGYEPINHTQLFPGSGRSAISMSMFGSIITGSSNDLNVDCQYLRLSIRDALQGRENSRQLSVHEGTLQNLGLHPDQRTMGPIGGYGGSNGGPNAGFSPPRIIAVKQGRIHRIETTSLEASQTSVCDSVFLSADMIKGLKELREQE